MNMQTNKRQSGNWLVKIHRLNTDGSHDFLNMLEFVKFESAKRAAANHSRESQIYATVYDVFNGCNPVGQWVKGRRVAWAAKD